MRLIICLIGILLIQLGCNPLTDIEKSPRPNILFIFTDDQAYWGTGRSGNTQLSTPVIDQLAADGAICTNFFIPTPVCSPSRASLMTSRYGSEVGITDWINHHWDGTLKGPEPHLGLDPTYTTWAEVLQKSGYETALIGKWHLGVDPPYHPSNQGFDHFMGFLKGGVNVENPTLELNGKDSVFTGFTTDILTVQALDYLKDRNTEKPFFLSLNYRAPHAPWWPLREEDWAKYKNLNVEYPNADYPNLDTAEVAKRTREYYGAIASVDRSVGRLLDQLKELELEENTIVIFTSDHGYNIGHNGIWHKGNGHWILSKNPPATPNLPDGQRPNMYDNSLKVPAIIRWPAVIKPNTTIENTATILDWYPTFLSMANVAIADSLKLRGRDLLPLLKGRRVQNWNNDFYGEYSTHHQSRTHMRAYRTSEWKLVMDYLNTDRHELFNLIDDPRETMNLYDESAYANVISELEEALFMQMAEINDPVLMLVQQGQNDPIDE